MEKIIKFYELEKDNLLLGDLTSVKNLCSLIETEKNNFSNGEIFKSSCLLIEELSEIFSLYDYKNINYVNYYIQQITDKLKIFSKLKDNYLITQKKLNYFLNFLQYLKFINQCNKIIVSGEKYSILYESNIIFSNFSFNVLDARVEFYNDEYVFFYSKTEKHCNLCSYYLDDLYGFKLFITYKKNLFDNTIFIETFDTLIDNEYDFYKKINVCKNWKIIPSINNKHSLIHINVKDISECFFYKNTNIKIKFGESIFVDLNKVFQFVIDFLSY